MRLELVSTNSAEDVGDGLDAVIAAHRRKVRDLVSFARDCDQNRKADRFSALRMERLSKDEQLALTVVAEAVVSSAAERRAKAMYLAELLHADAECMRPEDLVAAFRTLA